MIPQAPPHDLKRPSESEQESCDGKKPRTENPLVAANALACFAGPGSEDGSDTTDAAPSNENKQPVKQDEAPKDSVHYDDDDTETTAAASGAIQRAMLAVKQEQHTLAEREDKVKLQRSKAARFCAESRARRRLRTMVFEQSADPITQQLRLTQLQQLQQTQIRNQQLQNSVGIARPAVGPIVHAAQFANLPMSFLQPSPPAAVSFPFFLDPVSTALQSLPPHGSLAWSPFAPSAMQIATRMTQSTLAHPPMGFPAANAFLPQRGMARWVAIGSSPAPAPAFASIAPAFVPLPPAPAS